MSDKANFGDGLDETWIVILMQTEYTMSACRYKTSLGTCTVGFPPPMRAEEWKRGCMVTVAINGEAALRGRRFEALFLTLRVLQRFGCVKAADESVRCTSLDWDMRQIDD